MSAVLARSAVSPVVTARRSQQQQQRRSVAVAAWQPAISVSELESKGNKAVVEIGGDRVLVTQVDGDVYAVNNKCSHLGLPLVGKTALLQGEVSVKQGRACVTCPAHGTVFSLADGAPQGEWCPKLPNLPIIGKGPKEAPLKTYASRVSEGGMVEVDK